MGVQRTKKTEQKYKKFIAEGFLADECNLCNKTKLIKEFKHWKIVNNEFPWDRIAKINHMIIPKRHIIYEELNKTEKKEFESIKSAYIEKEYELIAEVTERKKSIPDHFHIHLIILKN
ncbi:MAG: hypothetical protein AAB902_02170 [Patescibacteria group bacterium]